MSALTTRGFWLLQRSFPFIFQINVYFENKFCNFSGTSQFWAWKLFLILWQCSYIVLGLLGPPGVLGVSQVILSHIWLAITLNITVILLIRSLFQHFVGLDFCVILNWISTLYFDSQFIHENFFTLQRCKFLWDLTWLLML